jgi:hypothetical protein
MLLLNSFQDQKPRHENNVQTFNRFAPFNRRAARLRSRRFERFERLEREQSDWRNVALEPQRVVHKNITTEKFQQKDTRRHYRGKNVPIAVHGRAKAVAILRTMARPAATCFYR